MSAVSTPTPITRATSRTIAARPFDRRLFELLQTGRLNLVDLVNDEAQARHVASQFGQGIRRQQVAFRRAKLIQTFGRLAQCRLEVADTEANQACFIRLMMRVRSPTKFSRSRVGRLASSS